MAKMNVPNFPMYPVIKHEKMREYSDGIRFGGGLDLRPAPYLPVVEVDRNLNAAKVIKKGTFVTLDSNGFVVPAFTEKPDVKVGGAETEAVTLAQPANNKVTVAGVAEVSWVGEPTWRSNYSLTVTVDTSKNASVYLNGSETPLITGSAATGLYIPQLGLTVKALNDNADQTAYFKFQYAVGEALEYGQYDVEFGVIDVDSYSTTKAAVTAPKTSTAKIGTTSASDIKIGKPIGMTMFDVYQWDMGKDPWYQVQDPITILADRMILLAVDPAHKDVAYEAGDILVLDPSGFPVPFDVTVDAAYVDSVAAAVTMLKDTLKYHVGRLVKVIDLAKEPMFTGGLENVEYWPSEFAQGLPGKQNGGVTDGIDETTKKGLLIQLEF